MATELEKALADVENRWAGAPYNYPDAWYYVEARLNRLEALLNVAFARLGGDDNGVEARLNQLEALLSVALARLEGHSGHTPPPDGRGLVPNPYNR